MVIYTTEPGSPVTRGNWAPRQLERGFTEATAKATSTPRRI